MPLAPGDDPTRQLHALGQCLWLNTLARPLLRSGALPRYITESSITGLTANLRTFEQAIGAGDDYADSLRNLAAAGLSEEDMLFELTLQDATQAAELFHPIFEASDGDDGWVSAELSPLLADNALHTVQTATKLFECAGRANLFVKVPSTPEGLRAVEALTFHGVPVNVTLLFSPEQGLAAAEAHLRGLERRVAAGLDAKVQSVASFSVSGWDAAVKLEISPAFHDRLGIAMAMRAYRAHRALLASARWQRLAAAGARPQRLLWASTDGVDPAAPDTLYVQALAAAGTISTLSETTLMAFADHGQVGTPMPANGGYADAVLEEFRREGVDDAALATRLQREGVDGSIASWRGMLSRVRETWVAAEPTRQRASIAAR